MTTRTKIYLPSSEVRSFAIDSYAHLCEKLTSIGVNLKEVKLQYRDSDNDHVTFSSQAEFEEAVNHANPRLLVHVMSIVPEAIHPRCRPRFKNRGFSRCRQSNNGCPAKSNWSTNGQPDLGGSFQRHLRHQRRLQKQKQFLQQQKLQQQQQKEAEEKKNAGSFCDNSWSELMEALASTSGQKEEPRKQPSFTENLSSIFGEIKDTANNTDSCAGFIKQAQPFLSVLGNIFQNVNTSTNLKPEDMVESLLAEFCMKDTKKTPETPEPSTTTPEAPVPVVITIRPSAPAPEEQTEEQPAPAYKEPLVVVPVNVEEQPKVDSEELSSTPVAEDDKVLMAALEESLNTPVEETPAPVQETPAPVEETPAPVEETPKEEEKQAFEYQEAMDVITSMGFQDDRLTRHLLNHHQGDLNRVVELLLKGGF